MKVAVLGLGAMGAIVARRYQEAGHEVSVYNRDRRKADAMAADVARVAASPFAAASGSDLVISLVKDDAASRQVWVESDGAAVEALRAGQVVLEMSTVSPGWAVELAAAVAKAGASFFEAPVSGSLPQARSGQLIAFLAGDESRVEAVRAMLRPISQQTHFVGGEGAGARMKLLANGFFLAQVAALAEAVQAAQASGVDVPFLANVLQALPMTSAAAKGILQLAIEADDEPRFSIELAEKDLRYLSELARSEGVEMPVARASLACFERAAQEGLIRKNVSAVVRPRLRPASFEG